MGSIFTGYQTRPLEVEEFLTKYRDQPAPIVAGEFDDTSKHEDHVLYQVAKPVDPTVMSRDTVQQIYRTMLRSMYEAGGLGIAAPQVGLSLQICIIGHDPARCPYEPYKTIPGFPDQVFINPRITAVSDKKITFWAGCLSAIAAEVPFGQLANYQWLEYEALDENLQPKKGRLDHFESVIFQHEFDHLLGTLYTDRAKTYKKMGDLSQDEILDITTPAPADMPMAIGGYQIGSAIERFHH